jgi:hypothetical protein
MSDQEGDDDKFSAEATERRVKDALRRALNTPPQHKPSPKAAKTKERPTTKARVHRAKSQP